MKKVIKASRTTKFDVRDKYESCVRNQWERKGDKRYQQGFIDAIDTLVAEGFLSKRDFPDIELV